MSEPCVRSVDTEISGSKQSERLDVRGLSVNGVMAGILAPRELLGDLASADSDTTRPGLPALASDDRGYLLVSSRQTPSAVQWLGLLMGSDGQGLKTLDLSLAADRWGPTALAWMGVHYLVVTGAGSSSGMHARRGTFSMHIQERYWPQMVTTRLWLPARGDGLLSMLGRHWAGRCSDAL